MDNYRVWEQHEASYNDKHEICGCCGGEIYYGDATHEPDECIQIDDKYICRDCIEAYMMKKYGIRLEVTAC